MAGPIQSEINNIVSMVATGAGAYKHFVNQSNQLKAQEEAQATQSQIEHGAAHQEALGKEALRIRREFLRDPENKKKDLISGDYYNRFAAQRLQK